MESQRAAPLTGAPVRHVLPRTGPAAPHAIHTLCNMHTAQAPPNATWGVGATASETSQDVLWHMVKLPCSTKPTASRARPLDRSYTEQLHNLCSCAPAASHQPLDLTPPPSSACHHLLLLSRLHCNHHRLSQLQLHPHSHLLLRCCPGTHQRLTQPIHCH